MWYVCDVLFVCFVVRGCAVLRRYIDVCNCEMFSVVNVYFDRLKFCVVCISVVNLFSGLGAKSVHGVKMLYLFTRIIYKNTAYLGGGVTLCIRPYYLLLEGKSPPPCPQDLRPWCVLMVAGMSVVMNVVLSLMSVMSPPPALCNLSVRTVVNLCTLGVWALGVTLIS